MRNQETEKYMQTRKNYKFNYSNCSRNCPILNHLEVTSSGVDDYYAKWRITSGFIFNGTNPDLLAEKENKEWVRNAAPEEFNEDL